MVSTIVNIPADKVTIIGILGFKKSIIITFIKHPTMQAATPFITSSKPAKLQRLLYILKKANRTTYIIAIRGIHFKYKFHCSTGISPNTGPLKANLTSILKI